MEDGFPKLERFLPMLVFQPNTVSSESEFFTKKKPEWITLPYCLEIWKVQTQSWSGFIRNVLREMHSTA